MRKSYPSLSPEFPEGPEGWGEAEKGEEGCLGRSCVWGQDTVEETLSLSPGLGLG